MWGLGTGDWKLEIATKKENKVIFDSAEMARLREKYAGDRDFRVPNIVFLDRSDELGGERAQIEDVMSSIPAAVQKDWSARLLSTDHAQHKGVWFQILLTPWLRQMGDTVVEPEIHGANPDFVVEVAGLTIVVEAKAILKNNEQRERDVWDYDVIWVLNKIQRPYAVFIKRLNLIGPINVVAFRERVVEWLDRSPSDAFQYEEPSGNRVLLNAQYSSLLNTVGTLGPTRTFWVNSAPLKSPLRDKALQHKAIRDRGYPYVIAMYLEDHTLDAEEVVEAWFGKEETIVDVESGEVVDQRIDRSGITFFGRDLRHRSVSGVLVFRATIDSRIEGHRLRSWYIQNPYANQPIDPTLFPVEAQFVVKERTTQSYGMQWEQVHGEQV